MTLHTCHSPRPYQRPLLLILLVAFTFSLALLPGCSKNQGAAKKKIAGIVFAEDQFFRLVLFGMREAAKKNDVELLEANSNFKPDREIELVNTYVANHVDAIVVSPLSTRASVPALARARDNNIKVVTYNTNVEEDIPVSCVESDQFGLGASTGKAVVDYVNTHLGGKANVAILAFQANAPEQSAQRVGGFKSEISKVAGITLVAEQDAWMPETAVKKAGDILTAHPEVTIIWAANEGGTVGAVMAVKNAAKGGKVVVFGTDSGEQLANFLLSDDNILQATTSQQPFEMGSMAVENALKAVRGEPVEKKVSLPGILLSRDKPDEVRSFRDRLQSMK